MKMFIDPGNKISALVIVHYYKTYHINFKFIGKNEEVLTIIKDHINVIEDYIIEYPQPRGQPMYTQLVDTIKWIGQLSAFIYFYSGSRNIYGIDRLTVKIHLCNSAKAKDSNIRAAIISKFPAYGGGKIGQIGTKKNPGPLYGISKDLWAALGIAITVYEQKETKFFKLI